MSRLYLIRHARPAGVRPTKVVSWPLRRCRETADPYASAIGAAVEIDPLVGEIPSPAALAPEERGPWLRAAFAGRWADVAGDLDYDQWRRAVAKAVARRPGCAVFSHFVAINAALSVLAGDPQMIGFRPAHASISVFEVQDGQLRLLERGPQATTGVL